MNLRPPAPIACLLAWFFLVLSSPTAIASLLSPADRDSVEQQQRERLEQNRQLREELERSAPVPATQATTPEANLTSGPCFTLNLIQLQGASHLPADEQQRLTAPWLNQCLALPQLQSLIQQVSDSYLSRGYITSRAYLTEQDLSKGVLTIAVLEGKLETILLNGHPDRILTMAFPGLTGRILNLRDIEQGMEQINRTRRESVQIEILPGSRPGYSIVNLTARPEFPVRTSAGFDNSGQKSTGVGQLNASLTGNNWLGLADQWTFSGTRSSAFATNHNARSVQTGVSLPWGYWLGNYHYSYSDYLSTLRNRGFDWRSSGDSQAHRFDLTHTLWRSGEIKTDLSLGFTHRIVRNELNQLRLQNSSRKLTSITLGVSHGQKIGGGFATLNPALTRGLPWWGADNDHGKSSTEPRSEFSKWSLSASYYRPLSASLIWQTSLYGQWSPHRLYGSERLTLGGEASVRGFKNQYLSGDKGAYWRNEINAPLFTLPLAGNISALAALDGGYLRPDRSESQAAGTVWGGAIGLTSRGRYLSSQLLAGWPISWPEAMKPDHVSIHYRISALF